MELSESLKLLSEMSNKYGSNPEFVLAGGGNTSFKNEKTLFVKGSGTSLATIKPDDFVRIGRQGLAAMWDKKYSFDEKEREAQVLSDMMDSREKGENRRPSVETLLHDLFKQQFVLHVHPAMVNGITCSKSGKEAVEKIFPDAVWVEATKPGYILALACKKAIDKVVSSGKEFPSVLFLENHGIFFAAESIDEMDRLVSNVMNKIKEHIMAYPDFTPTEFDKEKAVSIAPVIRMLYGNGAPATVIFSSNKEIAEYDVNTEALSPDHIVYTKAKQLFIPNDCTQEKCAELFNEFKKENGYAPKIVLFERVGMFACGMNHKEAVTAQNVFYDALKIVRFADSFGGIKSMKQELIDFIVNWEVESYRAKVSISNSTPERLASKVTIITGGAQGFGKGIADEMFKDGAYIVVADLNEDGAKKASEDFAPSGSYQAVNVADEESVKNMVYDTVLKYGGLDIIVSNAGVLKAGGLDAITKQQFEFVTSVNYTGFFLCAKYASQIMKIQNKFAPKYMMDIVCVNSKSGLSGSNKNFAYAGSKFGGIGLTQSFALELAPFNIKVNAVCPGNFLDGPLWSDPEKGLFVQYLNAGKVPGAKTVDDVRKFYEAKVPMNRGCLPSDVACAIRYIVEQKYETGQALPVTGGQEMLN